MVMQSLPPEVLDSSLLAAGEGDLSMRSLQYLESRGLFGSRSGHHQSRLELEKNIHIFQCHWNCRKYLPNIFQARVRGGCKSWAGTILGDWLQKVSSWLINRVGEEVDSLT